MIAEPTPLEGVQIVKPRIFGDQRGYFFESYRQEYESIGIDTMVQSNVSRSSQGVLRGMHYQMVQMQAKLVSVIRGAIFDVAVDVRQGSPTFGQWYGLQLDDVNHYQLYVPKGYAHGFCVLSDSVDLLYQCSDYYHPGSEVGIRWDDPQIGIEWPLKEVTLSEKDARNVLLSELPADRLPKYAGKL
jgi:dTDP-4-dehydrorhamnose 3,5-epimerase